MSAYAHLCVGVPIEDILVVTERVETRQLCDPDTGRVKQTFQTTQYTYTICGLEMPIRHQVYPTGGLDGPNRRFGYDMEANFRQWLIDNGFVDRNGQPIGCLNYSHELYASWPVRHPSGILGLPFDYWIGTSVFLQLDFPRMAEVKHKAQGLLAKIGCDSEPQWYMYARAV